MGVDCSAGQTGLAGHFDADDEGRQQGNLSSLTTHVPRAGGAAFQRTTARPPAFRKQNGPPTDTFGISQHLTIANAKLVVISILHQTNREAFRGALILMDQGAISRGGFNGPYGDENGRQQGFVEYGTSHVMKVLYCTDCTTSHHTQIRSGQTEGPGRKGLRCLPRPGVRSAAN